MIEWLVNNIAAAIIGSVVTWIISWIIYNYKFLAIKIDTIFHFNKEYRISFAYLFRIRINNKYLLIRGKKIDQYQPVGGVYKYFESFSNIKNKLQIVDERNNGFFEKNDLRIYVKGKNVIKFLKWIDSGENREINHLREFHEELIDPGYIDSNVLNKIKFEFIKRENSGVHYSIPFECKEILIFDVIEVLGIDVEIEKSIRSLIKENDEFELVDLDDIDRECFMKDGRSTKIGAHCKVLK